MKYGRKKKKYIKLILSTTENLLNYKETNEEKITEYRRKKIEIKWNTQIQEMRYRV